MLRQAYTRPLNWANKTMSVLRADQLEACEKDLAGLPSRCLFDPESSDADAEDLYALSFYVDEDRRSGGGRLPVRLHTLEELRQRVLEQYARELALLSVEEHDLLLRLALFGGRCPLQDWNELLPARGLVRRLWCRLEKKNDRLTLLMPHQLASTALLLISGEKHQQVRSLVEQVHESIENSLYLQGAAHAAGPARHLASLLKGTFCEGSENLIERFLLVGYDYVYDHSGQLLLIHPGLAEPEKLMNLLTASGSAAGFEMNPEALSSASDSVGDLEDPLYERMLFLLQDVTRPEIAPEDAVEDLIILTKQSVPFEDMVEVLSSMLICRATEEMRAALWELSSQIPRWLNLSVSLVQ